MTTELVTAQRFLCMLKDTDSRIRAFGLEKLELVVGDHWTEMVDHLEDITALATSEDIYFKEHSALLASKVYFHMNESDMALKYALEAGVKYIVGEKSKYEENMKYKCIEESIRLLSEKQEAPPKLIAVLDNIISNCISCKEFNQAIGIALETMQMDTLIKIIKSTSDQYNLIIYALTLVRKSFYKKEYKVKMYTILYKLLQEQRDLDYFNISLCLYDMGDVKGLANLLLDMCKSPDSYLKAMQICFDLFQMENIPLQFSVIMEINSVNPASIQGFEKQVESLMHILSGETPNKLLLNFMKTQKKIDAGIFNDIKETINPSNSITHEATLWANAIMNAGTADNEVLKANLEWVAKASNWEKFAATAGLGMIHYRNVNECRAVLKPYTTQSQIANSPYAAAGAYSAMGLANTGSYNNDLIKEYMQLLKDHKSDQMVYGVALGLGSICAGHPDPSIYEELKALLLSENSVKGDAAATAIGLLFMGTGTEEVVKFIYDYACETQHEKIIRSICLAIAFIETFQEGNAQPIIDQMCNHNDAIIRYGGMYVIGHAYAGTGNPEQIRKLLHFSASDVDDDVRRVAVINVGYILLNNPEKVPDIVSLLAESFNPYIRYGAAMAIGISCSGTGMKEAEAILIKMLDDSSHFTLQGVLIALSMVMIQSTKPLEPQLEKYIQFLDCCYRSKSEDYLLRFGAIVSRGILEAGGRNCTISLVHNERVRMLPLIGISIFSQFWYWFNNILFITYALEPTPIIGLNAQCMMPESFKIISTNKPSTYAYPQNFKKEEKKVTERIQTATLSLATRSKRGQIDKFSLMPKKEAKAPPKVEQKKEEEKKEESKEPEPLMEIKNNGTRVLVKQRNFIQLMINSRYVPVKYNNLHGFVMLLDKTPSEEEQFNNKPQKKAEAPKDEYSIPAEFTYDPVAQNE